MARIKRVIRRSRRKQVRSRKKKPAKKVSRAAQPFPTQQDRIAMRPDTRSKRDKNKQ